MANSTSTRLDVGNAILLNFNERTVPALTGQMGSQILNVITTSLNAISDASDWLFLQDKINAVSWTSNLATLPTNTSRVKQVSYAPTNGGYLNLDFVAEPEFDQRFPVSYTSGNRPTRWTYEDYNIIRLDPYPTTTLEQGRIWFYIQTYLTLPANDLGVFAMPEQFIPLLIRRCNAEYALRHSDDAGLAGAFNLEYQDSLTAMRGRHMIAPGQGINLYRGRKVSSYGNSTYGR